jgi:predicted ATP-grasp superfamily ATP-dependent carboligase
VITGFHAGARDATLRALLDLGRRLRTASGRKPPLYYGTDAQLAFVHDRRGPLGEQFAFLLNDDGLTRALIDKELFSTFARRVGVPVPATSRGDDLDGVRRLRPPLVVKPRSKVRWGHLHDVLGGCSKARVFRSTETLLDDTGFRTHAADLLVQEQVPGKTSDLVSFHGFVDANGRLLGAFCGRKIRTYPDVAGESSFIELTRDPAVFEIGRDTALRLGLRGVFKIDMIRDPRTFALFVLEVNARYNLWSYLGAAHGVNLPHIAYDLLIHGRASTPPLYLPRYRWLNFYRDAKACREAKGAGALRYAKWAKSILSSRKIYEAFAWDDPAPFVYWLGGYLRKKAW